MEIGKIEIKEFKQIKELELEIGKINFLIGGNNSGKSSVLQAIHTAVTAAQSQLEAGGAQVIAEQELRYSPTGDFSLLGRNSPFENRAQGKRAEITFKGISDEGEEARSC